MPAGTASTLRSGQVGPAGLVAWAGFGTEAADPGKAASWSGMLPAAGEVPPAGRVAVPADGASPPAGCWPARARPTGAAAAWAFGAAAWDSGTDWAARGRTRPQTKVAARRRQAVIPASGGRIRGVMVMAWVSTGLHWRQARRLCRIRLLWGTAGEQPVLRRRHCLSRETGWGRASRERRSPTLHVATAPGRPPATRHSPTRAQAARGHVERPDMGRIPLADGRADRGSSRFAAAQARMSKPPVPPPGWLDWTSPLLAVHGTQPSPDRPPAPGPTAVPGPAAAPWLDSAPILHIFKNHDI